MNGTEENANNLTERRDYGDHSVWTIVSLSVVYGLLSLTAFVGNTLVIWIICKSLNRIALGQIFLHETCLWMGFGLIQSKSINMSLFFLLLCKDKVD